MDGFGPQITREDGPQVLEDAVLVLCFPFFIMWCFCLERLTRLMRFPCLKYRTQSEQFS